MDPKTRKQLKTAIKEALDVDSILLSGGEGGLTEYNKKVEKFLNETFARVFILSETASIIKLCINCR